MYKGWINASENGAIGNARRENGFWNDVVAYIESKTKSDRRTYDMVCGKWKTVRPNVARFCGVYNNVKHMYPMSGVGDEDYYNTTTLNYEAEYGVKFTLKPLLENRASATKVCIVILSLKPINDRIVMDTFHRKKGPHKILVTSLVTKVSEFRRRIFELKPLTRAF